MPSDREEFDLLRFRELAERVQSQIGLGLEACNGNWRSLAAPRIRFEGHRDQILATAGALGKYVVACDWATIPGRFNPQMNDPVDDLIGVQLRKIVRSCGEARRLLRQSIANRGSDDLQHIWHSLDRCTWTIGQLCGEQPVGPNYLNQFWWKFEPHDVPLKPYKLLLLLWQAERNCCSVREVSYHIWRKGQNANALKQVIKQLNGFFASVGCPYTVSQKSGSVELFR